jgi:membrane protease YdiL (CAAX protease family)
MQSNSLLLLKTAISTVLNLVLLAGLPFLGYFVHHRWRHARRFGEIARRAGLQIGPSRYLLYSGAFALSTVALLLVWSPPIEPFSREGSPQASFVGLGFGAPAVAMALAYGVVQTGFCEELLFRGLIAGSLARRMSVGWANTVQALIFLAPHLLILRVMPEMWAMLPVVFVGGLFLGWVRIQSSSILGSWLIHASLNVTMCLSVAVRTAS